MNSEQRLTTSVVVITKDRAEIIGRLFEALTRQSLAPDEVVVVDNNSRASYAAIFDAYRARLPLRTFVETSAGIPAARNRGIREARNDIVVFVDDDCVPVPEWLERITEPFYRDPHIGAVGGHTTYHGATGSFVEQYYRADREATEA
ncbi:MAG TPA: glycosyltransferase family A protein [Polyangia bacterium]|nr:glycosyltransferase family A protein [Polyangia bacterium]